MKTQEPARNKAYMEVLKALRRLFAERYAEGGWLPPGREMAKELGVSDKTYWKALERMEAESFVVSYARRGHYVVPKLARCRKVGIVLGDGSDSPFVPDAAELGGALLHLHSRSMAAHVIQSSSLDLLRDNALVHGVDGLLWFAPPPKTAPCIQSILDAGDLPLVVVHPDSHASCVLSGACNVEHDLAEGVKLRSAAVLARGHRNLVYAGHHDRALDKGLVAALAAGGVELTEARCVPDLMAAPGRVSELVESLGATCVLAEGGKLNMLRLFEELAALPETRRPELLAMELPETLRLRFPQIKAFLLEMRHPRSIGLTAAQLLADHLLEGKPLVSQKIGFAPAGWLAALLHDTGTTQKKDAP